MNCYDDRIDVDIGDLENVAMIQILVISGDEIIQVTKKDGSYQEEDADRHNRIMDFHDANYTIFCPALGIDKIEEWKMRGDSNEWVFNPH